MSQSSSDVSLGQAMTSKLYRRATWVSAFLSIFHQLAGISAVLMFQTKIFLYMKERGQFDIPIIWAVQFVNFFNLFISFLSSIP
mmetsp:Transcript_11875/g.20092  ORF Transcript_11875/g.20092 Transcript_11875/m.20092 type:complete len:84 (+) Transcript_11875:1034-1285(+)